MTKLTHLALVAITTINRGTEGLFGPGQAAGARFECSETDAAPLLACGAAKLASEVDAAQAAAPAGANADAAPGLNAEDVANFRALAESAEAEKAQAQAAATEAQQLADAEKARADALQAQLDALKTAQAAASAGAAKANKK